MPKGRLEAFSDGVIAVAITLLALDLPIPKPNGPRSLAHELAAHWPNFAAFAISFLTIGVVWINHHAMLRRLAEVDHRTLLLNLVLLLSVCVLPFSTALMAEYLKATDGEALAAAIYAGSFLLMSTFFVAMQFHVLRRRPQLLRQGVTPEIREAVLRRNALGLLPYLVATVVAVVSPYATLAITAAIAVFYALPSTTADVAAAPLIEEG
jgi:TMEM175 potassium channel family protein